MGGVLSELTFTEEFFKELEAVRQRENELAQRKDPALWYTNMGVSQAKMSIYFTDSDYDWQSIPNLSSLIDEMDRSMERLVPIPTSRSSRASRTTPTSTSSSTARRSPTAATSTAAAAATCSTSPAHLQELWNSYMKEKKRLGIRAPLLRRADLGGELEPHRLGQHREALVLHRSRSLLALHADPRGHPGRERRAEHRPHPARFDLHDAQVNEGAEQATKQEKENTDRGQPKCDT